MAEANGAVTARELTNAIIASEERLGSRFDASIQRMDDRLRRVERWAYAVPLTFLIVAATVVGAALGRGSA